MRAHTYALQQGASDLGFGRVGPRGIDSDGAAQLWLWNRDLLCKPGTNTRIALPALLRFAFPIDLDREPDNVGS